MDSPRPSSTSSSSSTAQSAAATGTRVERSSSLTWGLEWDRNSILLPPPSPSSSSSAVFSPLPSEQASSSPHVVGASRMMRAFSADDVPAAPVPSSSSLLDASSSPFFPSSRSMMLPPAAALVDDFSPRSSSSTSSSSVFLLSPQQQQRQRATSDAAAVKAAWSSNHPDDSPYMATAPPPSMRRTHSAHDHHHHHHHQHHPPQQHVWDATAAPFSPPNNNNNRNLSNLSNLQQQPGGFKQQGRPQRATSLGRPQRATSLGSPTWNNQQEQHEEVYAFHDGDALDYQQGQYFPMSPMQHKLHPGAAASSSSSSSPLHHQQQQPRFSQLQQPPVVPPPLPVYPPTTSSATNTAVHADEQALMFEAQLHNLQAMQQQWMQMVQMQLDQTIYMTEQRFTQMSMQQQAPSTPKMAVPPPMTYRPAPPPHAGSSPRRHHAPHSPNASSATLPPPPPSAASSSLLAEHKVSGRRPSAHELVGHVVEFSRDSHGSRLIQLKMETGTREEKLQYVTEALPYTLSLARDLFGNYVVQNLFDNADHVEQRDALAAALLGSVNQLCTHPHGCRVVQRALFAVSPGRRNDLIEELLEIAPNNNNGYQASSTTEQLVRSHARDAHATHVVQKAVAALQRGLGLRGSVKEAAGGAGGEDSVVERARSAAFLEIIEQCVLKDMLPMSTHQQACRLVQRVIGACESAVTVSRRVQGVLHVVFQNIDMLAMHQNGNFVLQHMLECCEPGLAARVQQFVCLNSVRLARHKFGSHLVEKALSCATQAQVNAIIDRFLAPVAAEDGEQDAQEDVAMGLVPSALPVLMKDPYANFVVQKAFDVSRGEVRQRLTQEIRARTASLSKFSYGRHILTHINRASAQHQHQQQ